MALRLPSAPEVHTESARLYNTCESKGPAVAARLSALLLLYGEWSTLASAQVARKGTICSAGLCRSWCAACEEPSRSAEIR